jgi:hypothetical protein
MTRWEAYNPTTRTMETVDIEEMELAPGLRLIQMFWCERAKRFVTIPGASVFVVDANLNITPDAE